MNIYTYDIKLNSKYINGGIKMFVEVSKIKKSYGEGGSYVQVLKGVSVGVEQGEMCVIQGTSGSGKSTLLNCIGGLDEVDSGSIKIDGKEIVGLKGEKLSDYRRDNLGFIFQDFNLLDNFSLEDNIILPLVLAGKKYDEMKARMMPIVKSLEIDSLIKKYPYEISGGQKQRVANDNEQ